MSVFQQECVVVGGEPEPLDDEARKRKKKTGKTKEGGGIWR